MDGTKVEEAARRAGVPGHLIGGLARYVTHGIPPGGFLTLFLSNDLMGALGKADEDSRAGLFQIATFVYCDMPSGSHGSRDKVHAWIDRGGLANAALAQAVSK